MESAVRSVPEVGVEYAVVSVVAFLVATLTLLSGFGLGTLLLPAFAIFFPVPVAIAATAVVHLANNLFKVVLMGRYASWPVVVRFALPAAAAAVVGAELLGGATGLRPLAVYALRGQPHEVTVLKITVAAVMFGFALLELLPRFQTLAFEPAYLVPGGLLSGFFGGLSGHQGALRAAFLVKVGLDKQAFIGTSVVSAVAVDVARLLVYGLTFYGDQAATLGAAPGGAVAAATAAAFAGSFLGARLLDKVTVRSIQLIVGTLLVVVAIGLGTGLV
jgi:uncharacterized membrane protein YfcA